MFIELFVDWDRVDFVGLLVLCMVLAGGVLFT